MNKREQHLLKVEIDCFKTGYVSNKTLNDGSIIRYSGKSFEIAKNTGLRKRDLVLTESGYYVASELLDKAKYEIKRHLSCSDSFDSEDGRAMLANYEQAIIKRNKCAEDFELRIKNTEYK